MGEPIWCDLEVPRAPSGAERRLLVALAAAVDEPLPHAQVATVLVDAVCRCGCPSVRLRSEQPPVPGAAVARLSARRRGDHLAVEATGAGPERQPVSVVLHVVRGLVHELEVVADGEGFLSVGDVTALTDPVVG
ncbi:MAG: hypothetical protein ACLGI3_05110 [Actinomycetes bacterium]